MINETIEISRQVFSNYILIAFLDGFFLGIILFFGIYYANDLPNRRKVRYWIAESNPCEKKDFKIQFDKIIYDIQDLSHKVNGNYFRKRYNDLVKLDAYLKEHWVE